MLRSLCTKRLTRTVLTGHHRDRVLSNERNPQTDPRQALICQIRIEGHLGPQWSDWFEGLTITLEDNGETLLSGSVVDQAALHGLMRKVRDLGIPLLSVACVKVTQAEASAASDGQ